MQKVLELLEPVAADGLGEQAAADSQAASGRAGGGDANATGGPSSLGQAMTGHRKPAAAILLKSKGKDIKYALRGSHSSFSAPYYYCTIVRSSAKLTSEQLSTSC